MGIKHNNIVRLPDFLLPPSFFLLPPSCFSHSSSSHARAQICSEVLTEDASLMTPELEYDLSGPVSILNYWTRMYDAFQDPVFLR